LDIVYFADKSKSRFDSLVLTNHVHFRNATAKGACQGSVCLKYDVHVNNYNWWSTDPLASLEFQYWITRYNRFVRLVSFLCLFLFVYFLFAIVC
jgi:hypothetical protein